MSSHHFFPHTISSLPPSMIIALFLCFIFFPLFLCLTWVLSLFFVAVPSNVQAKGLVHIITGKGECWRTSLKFGLDCAGCSSMKSRITSCSITCSTSPFRNFCSLIAHSLLIFLNSMTPVFLPIKFTSWSVGAGVSTWGCCRGSCEPSWCGYRAQPPACAMPVVTV